MFKFIFLLSFTLACANAEITLEDITSKPPSRAKNFMIWQYLNQDISPKEADEAFYQIDGVSDNLLNTYAKKSNKNEIIETLTCMKQTNLLEIKDKDCLELAITPSKTLSMTKEQREVLVEKIDSKIVKEWLKIQSEPNSLKAYEPYSANAILTLFNSSTQSYRREKLNIFLDDSFLNKLSSSWKISQFIQIIVNDDTLDKLQISLLNLDGTKLNSQNNFLLALNHLKHSSNKVALKYFELSLKKATNKMDVDKNNFWMYKTTDDKKYLNQLLLSMDINIYSLYAYEIMNKKIENYFTSVKTTDQKSEKNLDDPFDLIYILDEIKSTPKSKLFDLASAYNQKDMVAIQTIILEKAYDYKIHGFVMPYDQYLNDVSNEEKAFIYAIMKQESHLIPSAISRSYALGLMQIMPFLVDSISKNYKEPIRTYSDMFIPKNNLNYALEHLAWMRKSLYHPLFMAYAYNGGMGFFKRHLLDGAFNEGKYEPFLSMELMANAESREYGKKVLANYVMYRKILGESISIVHLFDILTQPKKTDRFRVQG
ncbi:lytic transglycosylase domain-containing protein [bacterium]|nr:lytic transglycosylase domain-containing protein [bacterium]MBU1995489.1 lytic transglycosylase domain-containing protein [bacterium]